MISMKVAVLRFCSRESLAVEDIRLKLLYPLAQVRRVCLHVNEENDIVVRVFLSDDGDAYRDYTSVKVMLREHTMHCPEAPDIAAWSRVQYAFYDEPWRTLAHMRSVVADVETPMHVPTGGIMIFHRNVHRRHIRRELRRKGLRPPDSVLEMLTNRRYAAMRDAVRSRRAREGRSNG